MRQKSQSERGVGEGRVVPLQRVRCVFMVLWGVGGYNVRYWRTGQASVFAGRAPGLFETREGKARYSEDISQDMSSQVVIPGCA